MPTLSVVVYHPDLGGIRLGLRHSDGRRVGHRGHGCGWHHQGRHNSNKNTLKFVHNESRPSDRGKVTEGPFLFARELHVVPLALPPSRGIFGSTVVARTEYRAFSVSASTRSLYAYVEDIVHQLLGKVLSLRLLLLQLVFSSVYVAQSAAIISSHTTTMEIDR